MLLQYRRIIPSGSKLKDCLLTVCRVYQVGNVKVEWNLIKTLPDLSGTGISLFCRSLLITIPTWSTLMTYCCDMSFHR